MGKSKEDKAAKKEMEGVSAAKKKKSIKDKEEKKKKKVDSSEKKKKKKTAKEKKMKEQDKKKKRKIVKKETYEELSSNNSSDDSDSDESGNETDESEDGEDDSGAEESESSEDEETLIKKQMITKKKIDKERVKWKSVLGLEEEENLFYYTLSHLAAFLPKKLANDYSIMRFQKKIKPETVFNWLVKIFETEKLNSKVDGRTKKLIEFIKEMIEFNKNKKIINEELTERDIQEKKIRAKLRDMTIHTEDLEEMIVHRPKKDLENFSFYVDLGKNWVCHTQTILKKDSSDSFQVIVIGKLPLDPTSGSKFSYNIPMRQVENVMYILIEVDDSKLEKEQISVDSFESFEEDDVDKIPTHAREFNQYFNLESKLGNETHKHGNYKSDPFFGLVTWCTYSKNNLNQGWKRKKSAKNDEIGKMVTSSKALHDGYYEVKINS